LRAVTLASDTARAGGAVRPGRIGVRPARCTKRNSVSPIGVVMSNQLTTPSWSAAALDDVGGVAPRAFSRAKGAFGALELTHPTPPGACADQDGVVNWFDITTRSGTRCFVSCSAPAARRSCPA